MTDPMPLDIYERLVQCFDEGAVYSTPNGIESGPLINGYTLQSHELTEKSGEPYIHLKFNDATDGGVIELSLRPLMVAQTVRSEPMLRHEAPLIDDIVAYALVLLEEKLVSAHTGDDPHFVSE